MIPSHKVTISRLNRIGRQLQPVKLAAGEWAVNWQTTSEYHFGLHFGSPYIHPLSQRVYAQISNNILF